jgi:hypothetical protein
LFNALRENSQIRLQLGFHENALLFQGVKQIVKSVNVISFHSTNKISKTKKYLEGLLSPHQPVAPSVLRRL